MVKNHYNIKFLKGYGFSISVKDSKIILKNCYNPFEKPDVEEWFARNMPYEKIVLSGKGYISTEALSLLSENNRNVILLDTFGKPITFRDFIIKFYNKRKQLKEQGNPLQLPIKIILNAIYGKMGQKQNRKIGNVFNPVIFAFITGYARAQLIRFVKQHDLEKDVVAFATDSVCVTRAVNVDSDELGEFSFEKYAEDVYYLQNGFYRFGSWKLRGLGKLGKKEIEHIDTIEKDGRLYYQYKILRTKKLASAIIQNMIDDIGRIKEETREVNLNGDDKRFWLGRLVDINDSKRNNSTSLNPEYFPERFELNDDSELWK